MANVVEQFIDPAGLYTGGYTSHMLQSTDKKLMCFITRGVIQVQLTSGTVQLQMRLSTDAPWFTVRTYDTDMIEEIVISNFLQVVVSDAAVVWLGETN